MIKNPEQSSAIPGQEVPEDDRDNLPTAHEAMGESGFQAESLVEIDKNITEMAGAMKQARIDLQQMDPDGRLLKALNSGEMDKNSAEVLDMRAQLLIINEGAAVIRSQMEQKLELTGRKDAIAKNISDNTRRGIEYFVRHQEETGQLEDGVSPAQEVENRLQELVDQQLQEEVKMATNKAFLETYPDADELIDPEMQTRLTAILDARKDIVARLAELGKDKIDEEARKDDMIQKAMASIEADSDKVFQHVLLSLERRQQTLPDNQKYSAEEIDERVNREFNTLMRGSYLDDDAMEGLEKWAKK